MKVEGIAAVTLLALAVAVLCAASPADAGEPDEAELPGGEQLWCPAAALRHMIVAGASSLRLLRGVWVGRVRSSHSCRSGRGPSLAALGIVMLPRGTYPRVVPTEEPDGGNHPTSLPVDEFAGEAADLRTDGFADLMLDEGDMSLMPHLLRAIISGVASEDMGPQPVSVSLALYESWNSPSTALFRGRAGA